MTVVTGDRKMRRICLIFAMSLVLAVTNSFAASSLTFRHTKVEGDRVTVYLSMESGSEDNVSALNFQLKYDSSVLRPISADAHGTASDSGKSAQANMASPGTYNILLMGVNTNTISSGDVLEVVFQTKGDALSGQSSLRIEGLVMATPEGKSIPSSGDTYTFLSSGEEAVTEEETVAEETEEGDVVPVEPRIPPIPIERPIVDERILTGGKQHVGKSGAVVSEAAAVDAENSAKAALAAMSKAAERAGARPKDSPVSVKSGVGDSEEGRSLELTSTPEGDILYVSGSAGYDQAKPSDASKQSGKLDKTAPNVDNTFNNKVLLALVVGIAISLTLVVRQIRKK